MNRPVVSGGPNLYQHHLLPHPTRASATSSAFSASAHPHEDWTKISDLAERRRIQNRIAQRNYRKKLKKRLEDLETRAAANSASPEQKPAQLSQPTKKSSSKKRDSQQRRPSTTRPSPIQVKRDPSDVLPIRSSSDPQHMGFLPLPDDQMFSEQFTRQLSTSPPPPFTYPLTAADPFGYPPFTTQFPYSTMTASCSAQPHMYPYQPQAFAAPYPSPLPGVDHYPPSTTTTATGCGAVVKQTAHLYPTTTSSIKQDELYPDAKQEQLYPAELHSFNSIGYAAMDGINPAHAAFSDATLPPTPPLSETFENPYSESPPETSTYPQTPATFPPSPPVVLA